MIYRVTWYDVRRKRCGTYRLRAGGFNEVLDLFRWLKTMSCINAAAAPEGRG